MDSARIRLETAAILRAALLPPPSRTLWEWAEANVRLSPKTGTFSPGVYRTMYTPHVREVMECFQDPDVREIVCMFAAQTGKTLTETICADWTIASDPGNSLFVMPSEQMAKSFSASRLQTVIADTPDSDRHAVRARGKFNLLEMEFDNCVFALAGAGSPSNLASRPIKYLYLDELDKYPPKLGDEGDAASLAAERTKTFPNYKIFKTSTVTTDVGAINQAWEATDKREWHCPCPACGEPFIVSWERVKFPKEGTDEERAARCFVECPKCGHRVEEGRRRRFVTSGRWISTADGPAGVAGFRISELASGIGRPWPSLVLKFLQAQKLAKLGNVEALRAFVCSVLAEPWRESTDTMRRSELFLEYCAGYALGMVPSYMPISGITVGIDTQDTGFYYVVRAWGGGETLESWLVDFGFAEGFDTLERIVTAEYQCEDGSSRRISGGFIDSQGHRTQEVYQWCRQMRHCRIQPSKGERELPGGAMFNYTALDKDGYRGRPVAGGLRLCRFNTTLFKNWLDGKLRIGQDDPGAWHLCDGVTEDYCRQMASEYRDGKGHWQQRPGSPANHYWDCEVLALARAASLRLDKARGGRPEPERAAEAAGRAFGRW